MPDTIQRFALLDHDGRPVAFYASDVHGDAVPEDTVPISDEDWQTCLSNPGLARLVDDEVVLDEPTPPTYAELRRMAYETEIPIGDQLDALAKGINGPEWAAVVAKRQAIKARYPKPA